MRAGDDQDDVDDDQLVLIGGSDDALAQATAAPKPDCCLDDNVRVRCEILPLIVAVGILIAAAPSIIIMVFVGLGISSDIQVMQQARLECKQNGTACAQAFNAGEMRECLWPRMVSASFHAVGQQDIRKILAAGRCQHRERPSYCRLIWSHTTAKQLLEAEMLTAEALKCMHGARVPMSEDSALKIEQLLEERLLAKQASSFTVRRGLLRRLMSDESALGDADIALALSYWLGDRWAFVAPRTEGLRVDTFLQVNLI